MHTQCVIMLIKIRTTEKNTAQYMNFGFLQEWARWDFTITAAA